MPPNYMTWQFAQGIIAAGGWAAAAIWGYFQFSSDGGDVSVYCDGHGCTAQW